MRKYSIRKAAEGDAAGMAALDRRCFSSPWSFEAFESEITRNKLAYYLVCVEGAELVGYAGLWVIAPEGHVTNVAVRPEARRRGLGARLMSELMRRTRGRFGLTEFTLEVRVSNFKAIRMYEKLGFVMAGRRKGYYADTGEDAMIMWRMPEPTRDEAGATRGDE
ncbi:MAG: ribosomal protein S18-alanine N-acetyltransferase [Clostridiales Family XIII bacterium]|jgi:ribosomal-protein-alanine N-acetyltransferase|nr:ribosomal protein S18-alanine N-acetyltransferase [Clostridiales Family XIII bacterium]